jgi:hypothetical protein
MKPMRILGQSFIHCFAITKEPFHYQKGMLDFGANRRLTTLNLLFPIQAGRGLLNAPYTAVDAIVDEGELSFAGYFLTLCNADVTRI